MLFWILLCSALAGVMIGAALLLEWHQSRRPDGVSASDWQRVSEERERAHLSRVMGKPR